MCYRTAFYLYFYAITERSPAYLFTIILCELFHSVAVSRGKIIFFCISAKVPLPMRCACYWRYSITSALIVLAKDYGLKDQIQRAAVSVGSNIAEGFARNGNKEFAKFLWIAKGSAAEVQSQLYTAKDIGYISDADFNSVYEKAESCIILIYRFLKSLRASPISGERYK